MPTFRPRLRSDVELRTAPEPALSCPKTGHTMALEEPWQRRVVEAVDGERTLPALVALATAEGPDGEPGVRDPNEAVYLIKSLRYLRMLDEPDDLLPTIGLARKHPEKLLQIAPLTTLPDAQFDCHMCGACCGNQRLGPIQPIDADRLRRLVGIEQRFPATKVHGRIRHDPDGFYLPSGDDGHCIYQRADGLCGIHAEYGPEHKPDMCHLFPTSAAPTVFGIAVFDRADCLSYGKSAFSGPSYQERSEELAPQLHRLAEGIPLFHPQINLDGYLAIDYGYFAPFEAYLLRLLRDERLGGTIGSALEAIRESTLHLLAVLTGADDATETPDRLVHGVVAVPPAARGRGVVAAPVEERGLTALHRWLTERRADLDTCLNRSRGQTQISESLRRLERHFGGMLDEGMRDLDALVWRFEDRLARERTAPTTDRAALERLVAAAAALPFDAEGLGLHRRLVRLVRDLLFSKWYAAVGTFTNMIAVCAALAAQIELGGRLGAAARGASAVEAEDLDRAQTRALRLARMPGLTDFPFRIVAAHQVLNDLVVPVVSGSEGR